MRLEKIKLAGFKSFVDPTIIELKSSLVGVVGPNGCGKSNIIDAVRWVMGESSAKNLRGESSIDVIFNGSSGRKPVGKASVELVFDNSDGGLGGEYAGFSQISVRREVTREAQSTYFLNGSRCRRRDITNIFLGTGMGPRSYAIIQQGTISQFVEAKPQELRVFMEEAAGISKYKERRRETENRMRHTRENLERLTDLRDELARQLDKLQRQSRNAERFKVLKAEEHLMRAQLQALHWQALDKTISTEEVGIREYEVELEAVIAKQRNCDSQIEQHRESQHETTEVFNEVQSRYYAIGADIARLEQSLQHSKDRLQQLDADIEKTQANLDEACAHDSSDQVQINELQLSIQALTPQHEAIEKSAAESTEILTTAEEQMANWQSSWDGFNETSAKNAQTAEVSQTQIQNIERRITDGNQRQEKLQQEYSQIRIDSVKMEIEQLQQRIDGQQTQISVHETMVAERAQQLTKQREHNQILNKQLNEQRSQLQEMRGRYSSLEALQQNALSQHDEQFNAWLKANHLTDKPRLAQQLSVETGFETALETVLQGNLQAFCIDDLSDISSALTEMQAGQLMLLDTQQLQQQITAAISDTNKVALLDKIKTPWSLQSILQGIYVCDDVTQAMQLREQLTDQESIVTKDGVWLAKTWLRVNKNVNAQAGVIARERELNSLQTDIQVLTNHIEQDERTLIDSEQQLTVLQQEREQAQAELNKVMAAQSDLRAQLSVRKSRLEQLQQRQQRIQQDVAELEQQTIEDRQELESLRHTWQTAMQAMDSDTSQREQLQAQRDEYRAQLDAARLQSKVDQETKHDVSSRLNSARAQLNSLQQAQQRLQRQIQQLRERLAELQTTQSEIQAPLAEQQEQLQLTLAKRSTVEEEMNAARSRLENVEAALREQEQLRGDLEQQLEKVRQKLEKMRLGLQEAKVRRSTIVEQLSETEFALETLLREMPDETEEQLLQQEIEQICNKIARLGPINLAAIEEFETQSERKTYLDAQHEDLSSALETLENAIRKIDRETRTRFKETFDKINASFKELFPNLFGGGSAYLELTGDELLDAGVTVMAKPPGKKNTTIHLLSGGEKALTAISLVFAIFKLNPAPFCMLDEVDAPLDDANVGRYSDLVRKIAETVQVVFISHNKVAIEMARQLSGVTMNEPGVSRMVSVDIDEAVAMAEA